MHARNITNAVKRLLGRCVTWARYFLKVYAHQQSKPLSRNNNKLLQRSSLPDFTVTVVAIISANSGPLIRAIFARRNSTFFLTTFFFLRTFYFSFRVSFISSFLRAQHVASQTARLILLIRNCYRIYSGECIFFVTWFSLNKKKKKEKYYKNKRQNIV